MVQVHEQRRVAGHDHHVRVAFDPGHKRRLPDRPAQIAFPGVAGDCILAHKNLRALAVIPVVPMRLPHKKFRRVVIMLVHHIGQRVLGVSPLPVVCDQLHVRILCLDRLHEQRPTLSICPAAIFVADFHETQIERRRMAVLCSQTAPKTVRVSVGIFDGVQRVLHPLPHLAYRDHFLVRHSTVDVKKRRRTEILAHLQIFVEPQTMRRIIFPDVPKWRPRIHVPNRVLPMIHVRHVIPLHPAPAGETHERRFQGVYGLGQIHPQPMPLPGLVRHQRNHINE